MGVSLLQRVAQGNQPHPPFFSLLCFFYINGCGWDYELMKHSVANMGYYFDWIGISFSYYSFFFFLLQIYYIVAGSSNLPGNWRSWEESRMGTGGREGHEEQTGHEGSGKAAAPTANEHGWPRARVTHGNGRDS